MNGWMDSLMDERMDKKISKKKKKNNKIQPKKNKDHATKITGKKTLTGTSNAAPSRARGRAEVKYQ